MVYNSYQNSLFNLEHIPYINMSTAPVKKKRVTLIKSPGQPQPIMNPNKKYNIEHPMYERLASQYTTDYIVTDAIKKRTKRVFIILMI